VIDVARVIAPNPGINDRLCVHREQQHVRRLSAVIVVTRVGLLRGDAFAEVLNDARPFADPPESEGAPSVNGRRPNLKEGFA
jgi:hypothetical protein